VFVVESINFVILVKPKQMTFPMKKIIIILAVLLGSAGYYQATGQSAYDINVRFRVNADTATMVEYPQFSTKEKVGSVKILVLNMTYNESDILNAADAAILNSGLINILSIDLVYTHDGNEELLETLNKKRLFELYMLAPGVFNRSLVKWRFVRQTGEGHNIRKMFHGYVIRYREFKPYKPTGEGLKKDVEALASKPFDNDLYKALKRIPDIEQQAIVVDFTGSMAPYYTQLMSWFFLKKYVGSTSFVFFNDGDSTADNKKKIGKTGGLYQFRTNNLDTILQYALKTVGGGYGGDSPENDVEAILQAIKDNPKVKEVVLIADNWADMRDYALIRNITKPVRVILCGTDSGINTQYLDLARATNGSVHTIEEDIEGLKKVSEGHEVKIGNDIYILNGGKFQKKSHP
jgi:hypothetical protein